MVSDIGPGMRMLIDRLEAAEGDFHEYFPLPNGYVVSVLRSKSIAEIPIPEELQAKGVFNGAKSISAGGSYGVQANLFEIALMTPDGDIADGPVGWCSPVDVARKMREWLPPL